MQPKHQKGIDSMSKKATIIRQAPNGNGLQWGFISTDAESIHDFLNEHWTSSDKVESLFTGLLKDGIDSLGVDMESTEWDEDSNYFNGEGHVDVVDEVEMPLPYKAMKFHHEHSDDSDWVCILYRGKWYGFNTSDLNEFKMIAEMMSYMQGGCAGFRMWKLNKILSV